MDELKKFADIHSHIIWGADDGASSPAEAVELLKLDREEGACVVFATPHFGRESGFRWKADRARENFAILKERAAEAVPEVRLFLGTEWYCMNEMAEKIRGGDAFRMNDTDYVLVEFQSMEGVRQETAGQIRDHLLTLKREGFRPILAHPERYRAMQDDWDALRDLADRGILLQVNAYDLDLNLSLKTKDLAQWLADERMISFVGSDMHGLPPKRTPRLKEGIRWLYEHTDEAYADAVAFGNAEKLLGI